MFILIGIVFFNGCSSERSSELEKLSPKTILRCSTWGGPELLTRRRNLATLYEQEHPDIKVKLQTFPWGQYNTKVLTMMAGGVAPDVMWIDDTYFLDFVRRNVLLDLEPFIKKDRFDIDDFHQKVLALFSYQGKQYGIPSASSTWVMCYNKDMFDKAGIKYPGEDWTWSEFVDIAKELTKDNNNDGRIDQYGFLTQRGYTGWMPLIWQNGGDIFNKTRTKCLLDSLEVQEAIQFLYDLTFKYKVAPLPSVITSRGGSIELWEGGRVAMLSWWPSMGKHVREKGGFRCGITHLPKGKKRATIHEGCCYAISKDTRYPEEAWELVKFLTGKRVLISGSEGSSSLPSRKSVTDSDIYLKAGTEISIYRQICLDSLKYARPTPVVPKWHEMLSITRREIDLILLGQKSVKDGCKDMALKINELLGSE